jgi:hypothetical protein
MENNQEFEFRARAEQEQEFAFRARAEQEAQRVPVAPGSEQTFLEKEGITINDPTPRPKRLGPEGTFNTLASNVDKFFSGSVDIGLPAPLGFGVPSQEVDIRERSVRARADAEAYENLPLLEKVKESARRAGDLGIEGVGLATWLPRALAAGGIQGVKMLDGKDIQTARDDMNEIIEKSNPAALLRKPLGLEGRLAGKDFVNSLLSPITGPLGAFSQGTAEIAGLAGKDKESGRAVGDFLALAGMGAGAGAKVVSIRKKSKERLAEKAKEEQLALEKEAALRAEFEAEQARMQKAQDFNDLAQQDTIFGTREAPRQERVVDPAEALREEMALYERDKVLYEQAMKARRAEDAITAGETRSQQQLIDQGEMVRKQQQQSLFPVEEQMSLLSDSNQGTSNPWRKQATPEELYREQVTPYSDFGPLTKEIQQQLAFLKYPAEIEAFLKENTNWDTRTRKRYVNTLFNKEITPLHQERAIQEDKVNNSWYNNFSSEPNLAELSGESSARLQRATQQELNLDSFLEGPKNIQQPFAFSFEKEGTPLPFEEAPTVRKQASLPFEEVQQPVRTIETVQEAAARAYEQSNKDVPLQDFTRAYEKAVDMGQIPSPELQAKLQGMEYREARPADPLKDVPNYDGMSGDSFAGVLNTEASLSKDLNLVQKNFAIPAHLEGAVQKNPVVKKAIQVTNSILRQSTMAKEAIKEKALPYFETKPESRAKVDAVMLEADTIKGTKALEEAGFKDWENVPNEYLAGKGLSPKEIEVLRAKVVADKASYQYLSDAAARNGITMPPMKPFYFHRARVGPFFIRVKAVNAEGISVPAHYEGFKNNAELKVAIDAAKQKGLDFESGRHERNSLFEAIDDITTQAEIHQYQKGLPAAILDRVQDWKTALVAKKATQAFERKQVDVTGYLGSEQFKIRPVKERIEDTTKAMEKLYQDSVDYAARLDILANIREPLVEARRNGVIKANKLDNTSEYISRYVDKATKTYEAGTIDKKVDAFTREVSDWVDKKRGIDTGVSSVTGRDVTHYVSKTMGAISTVRLVGNLKNYAMQFLQPSFTVVELMREGASLKEAMDLVGQAHVEVLGKEGGRKGINKVSNMLTGKDALGRNKEIDFVKDQGVTVPGLQESLYGSSEPVGMGTIAGKTVHKIGPALEEITRRTSAVAILKYFKKKYPEMSDTALADKVKLATDRSMYDYSSSSVLPIYNHGSLASAVTRPLNTYVFNSMNQRMIELSEARRGHIKPLVAGVTLQIAQAGLAGTFYATLWNSFVTAYNAVTGDDAPTVQEMLLEKTPDSDLATAITFGGISTATGADISGPLTQGLPGASAVGGAADMWETMKFFNSLWDRFTEDSTIPLTTKQTRDGMGLLPTGPVKASAQYLSGTIQLPDGQGGFTRSIPTKDNLPGYTYKPGEENKAMLGFPPLDLTKQRIVDRRARLKQVAATKRVDKSLRSTIELARTANRDPYVWDRVFENFEPDDYEAFAKKVDGHVSKGFILQNLRTLGQAIDSPTIAKYEHLQQLQKYNLLEVKR